MEYVLGITLLSVLLFVVCPIAEGRPAEMLSESQILNHLQSYYRDERSVTEENPIRKDNELFQEPQQSVKLYSAKQHLAEKAIPLYVIEREQGGSQLPKLYSESDHLAEKQVLPPHLRESRPHASFEPIFEKSEPELIPELNNEERLSHYGKVLN